MNENKLSFFRGLFNGLLITFLIFLLCFGCFMCGFNFHKEHTDLSYQSFYVTPSDYVPVGNYFLGSNIYLYSSYYRSSYDEEGLRQPTQVFSNLSLSDVYRDFASLVVLSFNSSVCNVKINPCFGRFEQEDDYWGDFDLPIYSNGSWYRSFFCNSSNYVGGDYIKCIFEYSMQSGFDYTSIVSVQLYTDYSFNHSGGSVLGSCVKYFDNNGKFFAFSLASNVNFDLVDNSRYFYSDRYYYIISNISDNAYYREGYDYGYAEGIADQQSNIYQDGFSDGKIAGYNSGYNQGLIDSNQYTFLGLMGAVVDAPVQTFIGLLNFEILGFNFLSFLTAIFTIGLIFFIVRFVFFRS